MILTKQQIRKMSELLVGLFIALFVVGMLRILAKLKKLE